MATRALRTAVIGLGTFGIWHVRVYKDLPSSTLVAVADLNEARAREVGEQMGVPAFTTPEALLDLPEVEAVSIAVPDHLHTEVCLSALERRKHVLVEKPLATRLSDAQRLVAAAHHAGVVLMVDFANRWSPPFAEAKRVIAAGTLGVPQYMYIRLNDTIHVPTKMLAWAAESSVAWFLGSHCVDLARWLLDDEAVRVTAVSRAAVLPSLGVRTADFYQATIEFGKGAVVNLENCWILPETNPTVFEFVTEIVGSRGKISIDTAQHRAMEVFTDRASSLPDLLMFLHSEGRWTGFGAEPIHHFVSTVLRGSPPAVTAEDGLAAVRLVRAMEEAAATGRAVDPRTVED
jgi:predicted dehydrogenase